MEAQKMNRLKPILLSLLLAFSVNAIAHDENPIKETIPQLRAYFVQYGPTNPLHNPKASSYRKWTKEYCEWGLLHGVHCTNRVQGHHFGITHEQIIELGPAFSWAYTNQDNLVSLCTLSNCPLCDGSCHLKRGHGGNFVNVNGNFVFMFHEELEKWKENYEKGDEK
jgi:hypothetical protein